jgi:hypothetical protein
LALHGKWKIHNCLEEQVIAVYNKMNKIGEKEMAKLKKDLGYEIKKAAEYFGHEIKEHTELAEHDTGVQIVVVHIVDSALVKCITQTFHHIE